MNNISILFNYFYFILLNLRLSFKKENSNYKPIISLVRPSLYKTNVAKTPEAQIKPLAIGILKT